MRKYLIILLFTTSFFSTLKAQETSELKIGIGDAITFELIFAIEDVFIDIFSGNHRASDTTMNFPYVFVDYRYPISDRAKVGLQAGYYSYKGTVTASGTTSKHELKNSAFVLLPGIDYRYLQKNKFKMYGNAMAGVTFINSKHDSENYSDAIFIFQVNPLGFSYGDNTAVFAELGVGISILNAGLKFKL